MKTRFIAFTAIAVLLSNVAIFARPDTRAKTAKQIRTGKLVAMLPASDAVVAFDSKRFLDDALPKILSSNQPMLAEVMAKVTEMETRTGIDLRKFEQVAVGIALKKVSAKETDYEPVAIASGDINAGALVAVAKLASNGTYRTEMMGERTIYVFSARDVLENTAGKTPNSKIANMLDGALTGLTKEVAVTAMDSTTLVMGSLARVRDTLEGKSKVASDISALLSAKDSAVVSFAAKPPAGGLSQLLPLDNDEFGSNVDAIRYLSGSIDVSAIGTSLQLNAKTQKPEQAQSLKETVAGLQMLGGAIFGGSKRPDQQVYGRMIKAVKVISRGSEVTADLLVPQSDMNSLIAGMK
ncbi:MAG: hypothetical protein WBO10_10455 [Pyrinomonadaceae bacterium]